MTSKQVHQHHFADVEQQEVAAKIGVWAFLASEVLLFAGLFMLYAALRVEHPRAFHEGIAHATKTLGSINTGVLLVSSGFVAYGVHAIRDGRRRVAMACTSVTIALAFVFIAIKALEYSEHWHAGEGVGPGGRGGQFAMTPDGSDQMPFWTLYYTTTGLHAVHVLVGAIVLGVMVMQLRGKRGDVFPAYRLELGATYWHLVDLFWIFLWPLFYLA